MFIYSVSNSFCFARRDLYNEWTIELKAMADRIISMRQKLFEALHARGEPLLSFSSLFGSYLMCFFYLPCSSSGCIISVIIFCDGSWGVIGALVVLLFHTLGWNFNFYIFIFILFCRDTR